MNTVPSKLVSSHYLPLSHDQLNIHNNHLYSLPSLVRTQFFLLVQNNKAVDVWQ